jgi:hypothetical protein
VTAVLLACAAWADTVEDTEFVDSDWKMTSYAYGTYGGSGSAAQVGGTREISNSCGPFYSGANNVSLYQPFTYDPAVQGALSGLSFSIDTRYLTGLSAYGFVVAQGANVWGAGYQINTPSWLTYEVEPAEGDYFPIAPGTVGAPDFSAEGAPLQFGFYTANSSAGGSGYTHTGQWDNFRVEFVPEHPPDVDGDGVEDALDLCPEVPDSQLDTDSDGIGNACDSPVLSMGGSAVAGSTVRFQLTGAEPGDVVTLFATPGGGGVGPCLTSHGQLCLDIGEPGRELVNATIVREDGSLTERVRVPRRPGLQVTFQAVIERGAASVKSDPLPVTITP